MRIISQDGCIDLPYEKVMLQRYKKEIYLIGGVENIIEDPVIAEYSNEEKAIKAMEACRVNYAACEYNKSALISLTPEIGTLPKEVAKDFVYGISEKYIFQFPKDEEVEV